MSILTKVSHKIFGSLASYGQLGKFGSFKNGSPEYATDIATSESQNIKDIQSLSNFEAGLYDSIVGNGAPLKQDINAVLRHTSRQVGYLYQAGIPEWDSETTYYAGSICVYLGKIYKSLTGPNLNKTPLTTLDWQVMSGGQIIKSAAVASATGNINLSFGKSAGFSISVFSTGRPLEVWLESDTGARGYLKINGTAQEMGLVVDLVKPLTFDIYGSIKKAFSTGTSDAKSLTVSPSDIRFIVEGLTAGTTYNFDLLAFGLKTSPAVDAYTLSNCVLCAREI